MPKIMETIKTNMEVIKVPTEPRYINEVSNKISALLEKKSVNKNLIFEIRLSLSEAVRNAMVHGNKNDACLTVTIYCNIDDDKIELSVEDQGQGFSPNKVPDPTVRENVTKESGRGVYLIRHLMDEVSYNQKGNVIRMTKSLR